MTIPNYTVVVGVDEKHFHQLSCVWPTWKKNKPSVLEHPMLVFFDEEQVNGEDVLRLVDHPNLTVCSWPPKGTKYTTKNDDKWSGTQRCKMLSGFVFVPAEYVKTPYWLKLDTDVVAMGRDDWIDPNWFVNDPAIVSHPWGFTRPPDLMLKLDSWVAENTDLLPLYHNTKPLNLVPANSDRVCHKRIISWCAFFDTKFNAECAADAHTVSGDYKLPQPSQDSYLFYAAVRRGRNVVKTSMKKLGWQVWQTKFNIQRAVAEAMKD